MVLVKIVVFPKTNVFEVGTGILEPLFRTSKSQHTRGKDIKNTGKNKMQKKTEILLNSVSSRRYVIFRFQSHAFSIKKDLASVLSNHACLGGRTKKPWRKQ